MNTKLKPHLVVSYNIRRGNGERGYSEGQDTGEANKKGKYKQEKNEANYKKQKKASNKWNTHINNLYSA